MTLYCNISYSKPLKFSKDNKLIYECKEIIKFNETYKNIFQAGMLMNTLFKKGVTAWSIIEILSKE